MLSAVEQIIYPVFQNKGLSFFIKRDDQIHTFISGNKWRKLKYILLAAKEQNKTHLVTFGGAWSNHLLATACAAARSGLRSTGIVRGEQLNNAVLSLCRLFGMNLVFISREAYRDKPAYFTTHFSGDADAFFIDEGGAGHEAVQGCAELVAELDRTYDHVFCASGTGSTAAGILLGLQQQGSAAKFHAVSVLKNGDFLAGTIRQYFADAPPFDLHTNYHFGGYAKAPETLIRLIADFASRTGILTDPVYTGKLLYAICDLAARDHFRPGSSILMIHTGGLTGLLGMTHRFGPQAISP